MGLFKDCKPNLAIGAACFERYTNAKDYFADKYAFVGEQLQKLCTDTGLLSVEAKVGTGTWFLKNTYKGGYEKYDCIIVFATAKNWKVEL